MSANDEKRDYRKNKKDVKQKGNRRRRRTWKRQLDENPEEAPYAEYDFDKDSSASMNGQFADNKRKSRAKDDYDRWRRW